MRPWVVIAGMNGMAAVAMGAWGAHGFAGDPAAQALVQRASEYQLLHTLALLAADRLSADARPLAHLAAGLLTLGILMFSGSLVFKAAAGALPLPMITPAGGVSLMAGWLVLALAGLTRRREK